MQKRTFQLIESQDTVDTQTTSPVRLLDGFANKENRPKGINGSSDKVNLKTPYKPIKKQTLLCHKLRFDPQSVPIDNHSYDLLDLLPRSVHFVILRFLSPFEIQTKVKKLNRYWRNEVQTIMFWKKLNILDKYIRINCLVERRSKGKLFHVVGLLDNHHYTQRIVDVMIANANWDDGLPPSILRELSYLRSLPHHDNINQLVEAQVLHSTTVSLVFEYYPQSLKELLKLRKNKDDFELIPSLKLIRQIAQGMDFLHSHGIMHRNIKPENILLTGSLQVKVSDFNLARFCQGEKAPYTPEDPKDRERSGRESKRLWYRAPELLLRKNLYHKEIDIWSFGCMLAEIVLGEPLFTGESEIAQLFQTFQMLGTPTNDDWNDIIDETEKKINFPQWKQYPINFTEIPVTVQKTYEKDMSTNRLSVYTKIQKLNQLLGNDGMDLLQRCLSLKPSKRPTFNQIIKHPWLNQGPFKILKGCQNQLPPTPQILEYIPTIQKNITPNMRSILIDWLIDVANHFDLNQETLHLAITYVDIYLSKTPVEKNKLQLVGVTAMKMADVYNERSREYYKQENCQEYAYITADEYTVPELIKMEKEVIKTLSYCLTYTTTAHIIKQFELILPPTTTKISNVILLCYNLKFFSDFFLQIYFTIKYNKYMLAWCYLFFSEVVQNNTIQLQHQLLNINFTEAQFLECAIDLKQHWFKWKANTQSNLFDAVHQKYSPLGTRLYNLQFKEGHAKQFYQNMKGTNDQNEKIYSY